MADWTWILLKDGNRWYARDVTVDSDLKELEVHFPAHIPRASAPEVQFFAIREGFDFEKPVRLRQDQVASTAPVSKELGLVLDEAVSATREKRKPRIPAEQELALFRKLYDRVKEKEKDWTAMPWARTMAPIMAEIDKLVSTP
jgi:uncharacterized protein YhdP